MTLFPSITQTVGIDPVPAPTSGGGSPSMPANGLFPSFHNRENDARPDEGAQKSAAVDIKAAAADQIAQQTTDQRARHTDQTGEDAAGVGIRPNDYPGQNGRNQTKSEPNDDFHGQSLPFRDAATELFPHGMGAETNFQRGTMTQSKHFVVDPTGPAPLIEAIADSERSGGGWLNVSPRIPPEVDIPPTPGPLAVFSKRGPAVPMATWVASHTKKSGRLMPAELGLVHPAAKQIIPILEREVPVGLTITQDHAKRGLVATVDAESSIPDVVDWMLAALDQLCPLPTLGDFDVVKYT